MPVDLSQVYALTRAAEKSLDATGAGMKKILDKAAQEERRTHEYTNRTFRLQGSTFALGPFSGADVDIEFGARMPYASFVENRGLSRVTEIALRSAIDIDYYLDGEAEKLARL
jgi:hypothetical protein